VLTQLDIMDRGTDAAYLEVRLVLSAARPEYLDVGLKGTSM